MANSVNTSIRSARHEDVPAIAALASQLGYPVPEREMLKRFESVWEKKKQHVFVAETSGTIIGWLEVFRHGSILNWNEAEVGALIVEEAARHAGIGGKLMDRAEEWAREHHCIAVCLRSNIVRLESHKFYERIGYKIIKTQRVFRKELDA
jgi:N-acetylglutamate synthase-like GNAT family acetyltransferase